jgi:hypothetical protein
MYSDLHFLLDLHPELYDPALLWNSDESTIQMNESNDKSKVVTYTAAEKYNNTVIAGARNSTLTMLFTVCADGTAIEPVCFLKAHTIPEEFKQVLLS